MRVLENTAPSPAYLLHLVVDAVADNLKFIHNYKMTFLFPPLTLSYPLWNRVRAFCLFFTLFILCSNVAAKAQQYRIGADDVLSVTVLYHPEFSVAQVTVPSSGNIQVPGVGNIYVAGKTTSQLTREVTKRLLNQLRLPEVTVSLITPRVQRVFVLGAITKPGAYDFKRGFRISEALALAGGLTVRPERARGTLSRPRQKPISLNFREIYSNSSSSSNLTLRNGDVLRVTEDIIRINVTGQVQRPGAYDVPRGSGVVEALAAAGGAAPRAALTRVRVTRTGGKVFSLDLYKALVRSAEQQPFVLQTGDLIVVPEARDRINVLGAVLKPGFYDLQDGTRLRVAEAVALAGGSGPRAALSRARVRHDDGTETPVDLYKITVLGLQDGNAEMRDGDAIIIPESRGVAVLGAVSRPGTYYIQEGTQPRLSDVLSLAGGLSVKPEQARISVARARNNVSTDGISSGTASGRTTKPDFVLQINPVALLELTDLQQNALVRDGDIVTVSAIKTQTIFVSGEVKAPGAFELREGDSVPALLSRAGGPTLLAALRQVSITRQNGESQMVDLFDAVRNGKTVDIKLREGDYVVVPQNMNRVLVTPAVRNPGLYPIPEDRPLTVGEALVLAGGSLDNARLKQVAIFRQTPNGIQRSVFSLDNVKNGVSPLNTVLRSGDVLYVPPGGVQKPSFWDYVSRGVGVLTQVF